MYKRQVLNQPFHRTLKNLTDLNMITSGISQFFVILLFLMLGVLLYTFTAQQGIGNPEKSDELFPMIATGNYFPGIVGILFIIGLIDSAYSAAGSALTALTTSFTVDILHAQRKGDAALSQMCIRDRGNTPASFTVETDQTSGYGASDFMAAKKSDVLDVYKRQNIYFPR